MTATVTPLPRIELDGAGRAFRAFVPSATRPGVMYEMARSMGGRWEHADPFVCRGMLETNRCYHSEATNKEFGMNEDQSARDLIVVNANPLSLVGDLSLAEVIEGFQPVGEWRYEIPGGKDGLSADGVQDGIRQMSRKGEAIRCEWVRLDHEEGDSAYFIAFAARYAISPDGREIKMDTTIRGKRILKSKAGEAWFEHGLTKAARNAEEALMPESLKQWMKAKAKELKAGQPPPAIPASTQRSRPAATQPPRRTDDAPMPEEPPELRGKPAATTPPAAAPPAERPKPAKVRLARWLRDERQTRDAVSFAALIAGITAAYPGAFNERDDLMVTGQGALTDEEAQRVLDGLAPEPAGQQEAMPLGG